MFEGAHPSGRDDADLRAKAYNAKWRAAHPGYMAAKCKAWHIANPSREKDRKYDALSNWRKRMRHAGIEPPPESYWKNSNGGRTEIPERGLYRERAIPQTVEERRAGGRANYKAHRDAGLKRRLDSDGKLRWIKVDDTR